MTPDLFSWKPTAQIVPFPVARRVAKVARVAEVLLSKHTNKPAAAAYWRRECTNLEKQLMRSGLSKAETDRQLKAFFDAVQNAMNGRQQGKSA